MILFCPQSLHNVDVKNGKEVIMGKLTAPGWTIPENATIELGYICWYDSADHTYWMVDPETGESSHKGDGPGCFWSDWE